MTCLSSLQFLFLHMNISSFLAAPSSLSLESSHTRLCVKTVNTEVKKENQSLPRHAVLYVNSNDRDYKLRELAMARCGCKYVIVS